MSYPIICEVSTENIVENARSVKSLLSDKTKFYAVVKSNAYGHGLVEISNILYSIVDGFCVSFASEALTLRIAGIDKEILLLTPTPKEYIEPLVLNGVTLTICNKASLLDVVAVCSKIKKKARVHIKLNTGMNRLGVSSISEVNEIISIADKSEFIDLSGAYSHLGDPLNKRYSERQLKSFIKLSKPVKDYNDKVILHLSSSGGILLGDKYHFDGVRAGLTLYGYSPFKNSKIKLKPAMKVYAKVLCVRKKISGERLLYGSKKYRKDAVTIIRLGYADGFFRGGGKGEPSRCMDLSAIDGESKSDYTLVFDNAEIMAKKYKTIPYDILTSCSRRAEMKYL